jgi:deazaflavin-dependent oxidoreductase (nitroreductase family)
VAAFDPDVLAAAAREREVKLTTLGRKSGKSHVVTIWVATDGRRLFIRSGEGLARQWPQNLLARGEGELQLGKLRVKVKPRLIAGPAEARAVSGLYKRKYGAFVRASKPNQPLTKGETATFELIPAESSAASGERPRSRASPSAS